MFNCCWLKRLGTVKSASKLPPFSSADDDVSVPSSDSSERLMKDGMDGSFFFRMQYKS